MAEKLNIYQKLIEVRKSVPYLKKENAGYQFKYVSSSQTLGALRDAMDAQGLLLVPKVVGREIRDHATRKGDHEYFTSMDIEFTWINSETPAETIVCPWYGQGLDDGEKGVGKALTYAEKFFLLKFFNIATDKDDPDSFQKKEEKKESKENKPPANQQQAENNGPSTDDKKKVMAEWFTKQYGTSALAEFKKFTGGTFENPLTIKTPKNVDICWNKFNKMKDEEEPMKEAVNA